MKLTLIVLGALALQFAVSIFMGKFIRAGKMRRCRDDKLSVPAPQ
jgi:hypothetical protein